MPRFEIVVNGVSVTAKNIHSGAVKEFTIRSTDDEISGYREYLVDNKEHLRVRLFDSTEDGLQDAVDRYAEGYLQQKLYRHPA